jgi:glycosyltransferase involved in cell wall biosynthesis
MKISVIMASFLNMPGRDRLEAKFKRAVVSFLKQTYENKELIIVSDGCEKTIKIYNEIFSKYENIKLVSIPKQLPYSGAMRNVAFELANGDIITYLDSDDVIGKDHLQKIFDQFDINKYDFVYYDDYMATDSSFKDLITRVVDPRFGSIGTSSISHKNPKILENGKYLKWLTGYGHDFYFVMKMASLGYRFKKLNEMPQYIVAHYYQADF